MKLANRAFVWIPYAIALAVAGIVLWVAKPRALHGESKRADQSVQTTNQVIDTTKKQSSEAAASVVEIGVANTAAPASKEKDFIAKEVPVALSKLEKPDPQALLDAEKRHSAVLEGNLQAINDLYAKALTQAGQLEKDKQAAISAKRASDMKLEEVAAEHLGSERTKNILYAVTGLAVLGYLYVKFTHTSPAALAEAVADIKSSVTPVVVTDANGNKHVPALDSVTSRLQQFMVRTINKLKG